MSINIVQFLEILVFITVVLFMSRMMLSTNGRLRLFSTRFRLLVLIVIVVLGLALLVVTYSGLFHKNSIFTWSSQTDLSRVSALFNFGY